MNPIGALTQLLVSLFPSTQALQAFVAQDATLDSIQHAVAWGGALDHVALRVVEAGRGHGLWREATFQSLQQHAPHKDAQITQVARLWGVYALLGSAQTAEAVESWFPLAPHTPGTPENLRALAAAADVPLHGARFMPFDQILRTANIRPPTPENVDHMRALLLELARITHLPDDDPSHPVWAALAALTTSNTDPADADLARDDIDVVDVVDVLEEPEAVVLKSVGFLPVKWLRDGGRAVRTVARLTVPRIQGQQRDEGGYGTGFLLTDQLLVTNHHVVNMRHAREPDAVNDDLMAQAGGTVVEFDLDAPGDEAVRAEVAELLCWSRRRTATGPLGLDFAILRLREPVDAGRRPRPLHLGALPPTSAINIVQHPDGQPKRVALRANQLTETQPDSLRYTSNTDEGSSGSPLFDDHWNVVGVHRASVSKSIEFHGETLDMLNVGTPMGRVIEALRSGDAQGPGAAAAWQEISAWHQLAPPVVPDPGDGG